MSTRNKNVSNTGTTALSVQDVNDVPAILEVVENQIANLKKIETTPWKTSGILEGFGGNIKEETTISTLIKAMSSVEGRYAGYCKAAEGALHSSLGDSYPEFTIGGTINDWSHDINLRIAIIKQDSEMKRLTTFRDKMSKFISESEQKEMLMKNFLDGK